MRPFGMFLRALACLCVALPLSAQPPVATALPAAAVKIESVDLQSVQPDRVELLAKLGLYPERSLKVKSFSFAAMKVNEMPVYVAPITGEFALKKGEYAKLPDLRITIYLRDFASVEPARQVVEKQKVVVSGQITAAVEVNPLEKLAMRSFHPRVVLPFNKEIPLLVPGGDTAAKAALAILDVAGQVGPAAAKLLGTIYPGQDAGWRNDVAREQVKHLVLVRTRYTLVDAKGSYPLESEQLGFWIGNATVMVPAEALEPWEFDPDAQAWMADSHAHVDKASVDVTVRPLIASGAADGASPWSLARGDFKIETQGKPEKDHVANQGNSLGVEVRQRGSANNYALLRFREGAASSPVTLAGEGANGWDRLAIVRVVRGPAAGEVRTEVVMLPGTVEGKQIRFGQPIDDSAFGSPVFTEQGVVAMVQDENSAAFLPSMKKVEAKTK